jgi:cell division protease FtsH
VPSWYVASGPGVDGPTPDDDRGLLLTTNRADLLEPAPAARPGRVDQAVG